MKPKPKPARFTHCKWIDRSKPCHNALPYPAGVAHGDICDKHLPYEIRFARAVRI
jgi:hypothetical protein